MPDDGIVHGVTVDERVEREPSDPCVPRGIRQGWRTAGRVGTKRIDAAGREHSQRHEEI